MYSYISNIFSPFRGARQVSPGDAPPALAAEVVETARRGEDARTATDRQKALEEIEQVLRGCQYNTLVMREAIYVSKQNGYSQLKNNTTMIGELVPSADGDPFPSWLKVLLVKREKKSRGRPCYELRTPNEQKVYLDTCKFKKKLWPDFEKKLKRMNSAKSTQPNTANRYLENYHALIGWYTKCGFFSSEFVKRRKKTSGVADSFYFLSGTDDRFDVMDQFFQELTGTKALRDMIRGDKASYSYLNQQYASTVAAEVEDTGDRGILIVGMSNFLSENANDRITAMETAAGLDVFTLSSKLARKDLRKDYNETLQTHNMFLNWDSPFLLANICREFKDVKFKNIYLDYRVTLDMKELHPESLTAFFNTTIVLLKESALLDKKCTVIVPFNEITLLCLHKSWTNLKSHFAVSFLSDVNANAWYSSSDNNTLAGTYQAIGTDKIRLLTAIRNEIEAETKKQSTKRKRSQSSPEKTDFLHHLETKVKVNWGEHTDDAIADVKWIRLEVLGSDATGNSFVWPNGTKFEEDRSGVGALPNLRLKCCNVANQEAFERYYDPNYSDEAPKITLELGNKTVVTLKSISIDDTKVVKGKVVPDYASMDNHMGDDNESELYSYLSDESSMGPRQLN